MAEFARITPSGWVHGDDADTFARVSPDGWEHQESAGTAPAEGSGTGSAATGGAGEGYNLHYGNGTGSAAAGGAGTGYDLHYGSGAGTAASGGAGEGSAPVAGAPAQGSGVGTATSGGAGEGRALHYGYGTGSAVSGGAGHGPASGAAETLGGRGSRGLLDMPTDGLSTDDHIRAVNELHEARLKQREAEQADQPAPAETTSTSEVKKPKKTARAKTRKHVGPVLPGDVIAGGLDPDASVKADKPVVVEAIAAKESALAESDAVNDDEFAIVLAQFLLAA